MGTCMSNHHEELLKELSKCENNRLILDHLKQNQENIETLAKSISAVASAAAASNVTEVHHETPTSPNTSISSCCNCKCQCHLKHSDSTMFNTFLTKLATLNNEKSQKLSKNEGIKNISNSLNNENLEFYNHIKSKSNLNDSSIINPRRSNSNRIIPNNDELKNSKIRINDNELIASQSEHNSLKRSKLKNPSNILIISSTSCNENRIGVGFEVGLGYNNRASTNLVQKVFDDQTDLEENYLTTISSNSSNKRKLKKNIFNEQSIYKENEENESNKNYKASSKRQIEPCSTSSSSKINSTEFPLMGPRSSSYDQGKKFIKVKDPYNTKFRNTTLNRNNLMNQRSHKALSVQPEFYKKNVEFNENKNRSYIDERNELTDEDDETDNYLHESNLR